MIAGSFASAAHGMPRTTQDVDVVIDPPSAEAFEALIRTMPPDTYLRLSTAYQSEISDRLGGVRWQIAGGWLTPYA